MLERVTKVDERWLEFLSAYSYTLDYRNGSPMAMPTPFPDSLNQPPTSTAPDPTASPALTPWVSTSSTTAV